MNPLRAAVKPSRMSEREGGAPLGERARPREIACKFLDGQLQSLMFAASPLLWRTSFSRSLTDVDRRQSATAIWFVSGGPQRNRLYEYIDTLRR